MKKIAIVWKNGPVKGTLRIRNGDFGGARIVAGRGGIKGTAFTLKSSGSCRIEVDVKNARLKPGSNPTMVSVLIKDMPFTPLEKATDFKPVREQSSLTGFTFFLRDVKRRNPIFIPAYRVAVTEAGDRRSYEKIEETVRALALQTKLQQIDSEPEESYENAAAVTRNMKCPTWLGLSRDIRIFEAGYNPEEQNSYYISPRLHSKWLSIPDVERDRGIYHFVLGRGAACVNRITRRLENGYLPILQNTVFDGNISYNLTAFVTLEKSKLTAKNLCGTHFLVADGHIGGHNFTEKQQKEFDRLYDKEKRRWEKETVLLCARIEAVNTAPTPRYAWFKNIFCGRCPNGEVSFDNKTGFSSFVTSGRVYCVSRMNGKPMPQNEMAILLQPGEKAVFEFFLPHQPIPKKRAAEVAKTDFNTRLNECRSFWEKKLASGAQVLLPEPRINEMVKAGLLHLDLVAYGKEPDGSIAPTIGIYMPIASESAPIIQFFDSMGWHKIAERALGFFLKKQRKDGFIQNCSYMLETGPALWSMGEHYRYTMDDGWVRKIKGNLIKACEFMLAWRKRNMTDKLRGRGYGLQDGKVADPPDPFHSFMLNGYAYLGMSRVAEMLQNIDPKAAKRWAREAKLFRKDIRTAFFEAMARSPVIPLGDGTWIPTAPPWAEAPAGPVALFAEPGACWTHGTFTCRDSMLGPLWLIFQEVLDPGKQASDFLLQWNSELMCVRNVGLSQPYYCRHPFVHLRRGEVKPFLKAYYNGFTGLADRETYTWWEHYFHASPHKTHEEAWFLMQTRWMLWMERGKTLKLLSGIPRSWLTDGNRIELKNVRSYFGPLSLRVESKLTDGLIQASLQCKSKRQPEHIELRLPHPERKKPRKVHGGKYDPETETVQIDKFGDTADVILYY